MQKLILLIFLVLFFGNAFSQNKITGTIVGDSSKPLSFVSVYLSNDSANGNIPRGALSNDSGRFELYPVQKGSYILTIRRIGYKDSKQHISVNADIDLNNISLVPDSTALHDVVVSSRKPIFEKKIDRFVFNVANAAITVGGNAWDILQHTPLVSANNSGALSIIGNSSAAVYINNRKSFLSGEDLMNYLQAMPADNIVSIEVITTPPASYDAGSGGGVINIVLKKILDNGLKGSLTLTDQQATYNKERASLLLTYKHNRYTQSLTVGGGLGKSYSRFDNTINYYNINQTEKIPETFIAHPKSLSANTTIAYDLSKNATIGGLIDYSLHRANTFDNALDNIYTANDLTSYINNNNGHGNSDMISGNLFYKFQREKNNQSFLINLDYFNYNNNTASTFYSRYSDNPAEIYSGNMSNATQNANNYSVKADYSQLIFKTITLETGAKYGYTETKNPYTFYDYSNSNWVYNPQISNYFIYKEGITAGYLSLEKKLSSKLDVKAGVRVENTDIKTLQDATNENHDQNYTRVLPTAYFSYKINDDNNLSFAIKNDFDRAPFYALNPFKYYTSNKVIEIGNPFLQPGTNISYELSYVFKSNYIFTAQYVRSTNLIGQLQTIFPPDTLLYQQANYGKSDNWSLISVINQPIIKNKWEANISNTIQWIRNDINSGQIQSDKTHCLYIATLNQTFKNIFNSGMDASLYGMYQSGIVNTNILGKSYGEVDFGLSKTFAKPGLKLALYVNDIFKTNIAHSYSIGNPTFTSNLMSYYDTRYIRISIVKSFGNKKVKNAQQRDTGNEDEKSRL